MRVLLVASMLLVASVTYAFNPIVFEGEEVTTVNATTGALYTVAHNGFLDIFAHAKIYFNLDPAGVTPNTNSKFLAAGGSIETNQYVFKGQKIGILSDSGTATVNFTTSDLLAR